MVARDVEPAFRRVAQHLCHQLQQGAFAPDTALPTEATIAQEHVVSRQPSVARSRTSRPRG